MMTTIRSFIAIELSDEVRTVLTDLQSRLKAIVPPNTVRWTAPQNVHLTLHFLGHMAADDVSKVTNVLPVVTSSVSPFSLTLQGLGCFPNPRRPSIVWVGISGEIETLVKLYHELGEMLKQSIGFEPEKRPYSPHLTIGRVKKGIPPRRLNQLRQALEQEQANVGQLTALKVTEISLIKSELTPTGPIYTPLARGLLKNV
jgi:2'-5' RNA ligase